MTASRVRAAAIAAAACAVLLPASARADGLDRAGYFTVVDRLQRHLEPYWDDARGRYDPGPGMTVTQVNADLLLVHAVAARHGHDGAARNDERARRIAGYLVGPDAWTEPARPGGPLGWRAGPDEPNLHMVFVSEAAEGLTQAYLARDVLGLDAATVAAIGSQIARVARSREWRWPALRLNQFNWYCALFAAHATVNGATDVLARDMGRHLSAFLADRRNLGPGLRFRYLPARSTTLAANFDSPEYANIVLGFSRQYGHARRAGMPPPARIALLRAWVRRALAGYWTHGGDLNWDSGLGFRRWRQRKKVPLAQHALLGIATEPELQPGPEWGAWAKWLLDRGLDGYVALADREGRIPAALAHGVNVIPQSTDNAVLAAARTAANAMRALDAGLGAARAIEPPALYSYDPGSGRLAVTTPVYNTAIVPVNHGAFPYGGLDITRLFDRRQEVAASIGGLPPASFGLRVRSRSGRPLLASQYGARSAGRSPVRLTRGPWGVGARPGARAAYAGPFTDLRIRGAVRARGRRITTAYRFTPAAIDARWTVAARTGDRLGVTFPSWGATAQVTALLRDGRTVVVGARPVALAAVTSLRIVSAHSAYRVLPRSRPPGAAIRTVATVPQPSAPTPGPSLEVVLRGRRATFSARLLVEAPI